MLGSIYQTVQNASSRWKVVMALSNTAGGVVVSPDWGSINRTIIVSNLSAHRHCIVYYLYRLIDIGNGYYNGHVIPLITAGCA